MAERMTAIKKIFKSGYNCNEGRPALNGKITRTTYPSKTTAVSKRCTGTYISTARATRGAKTISLTPTENQIEALLAVDFRSVVAAAAAVDGAGGATIAPGRASSDGGRLVESIYNLLPKLKEEKIKPPMYKSRADHTRDIPYSTFNQQKAKGSIFGIKGGGRSMAPRNFLRVGEGIEARRKAGKKPELPKLDHNSGGGGAGPDAGASRVLERGLQPLPGRRKPPVPRRDERPPMGLHSGKNFVTANAVEAILAVPSNRHRPPIDYLGKEDFGRVPEYLAHVQSEVRAENEMVEEFVREQMGISSIAEEEATEMPTGEQAELVDQLKAKWDDVNARYQRLVHQTFFDNGRLVAKARMEKELDEIEADISRLTRGPVAIAP